MSQNGMVDCPPELVKSIEESIEIGLTVRYEKDVRLCDDFLAVLETTLTESASTVIPLWNAALTFVDKLRILVDIVRTALDEFRPFPVDQRDRMAGVVAATAGPILFELLEQQKETFSPTFN